MVFGFDEDHTSILRSAQVFARYAALLDAAAKKTQGAPTLRGGHVRPRFSYAGTDGVPPVEPWLVLTPVDPALGRIIVPISARDSGRQLGPYPTGVYEASLLSYAFKAQPARTMVTLSAGQAAELRFDLTPIGTLSGYVGADVKPGANPAGSYREPHPDILIESITLSNGTIKRLLTPDPGPRERAIESYLAGQDYAHKSAFFFMGLDDGEYELTIQAAGYRPYRATRRVVAGQFGQLEAIELSR